MHHSDYPSMKFLSWLRSRLSSRYRAMAIYRQGMMNARRGNHQQAVIEYTRVIDMAEAPAETRAMALYNRSLVYDATGDQRHALIDLQQVLTMPGTTEQIRTEARRKVARMGRTQERSATEQA